MKNKLTDIFASKYGIKVPIEKVEGLIIEKVQYYQFLDPATMPIGRIMVFENFNQEVQMGASREFLLDWIKALTVANDKPNFSPSEIGGLAHVLKDALQLSPLEHYYRMATVFLFNVNENPYDYDYDLAKIKINAFKKKEYSESILKILSKSIGIFGLNSPLSTLAVLKRHQAKLNAYQLAIKEIALTT